MPVSTGPGVAIAGVRTPALPRLGPAPDFTQTEQWFNTPHGAPLHLAQLRGKVVLVDFWTYTCINCIRTLPFLKGLYATYHRYGLQIVGVETPEFTFEQEAGNVAQAIASDGLRYPVVQDNVYGTWNAYQNEYWPAEYLIDAQGQVRHTQFGEGNYREDEAAVRSLLYAAGAHQLPPPMTAHAIIPSTQLATPETYLDPQRAQGFAQPPRKGVHFYPGVINPPVNEFGLHGYWKVTSQSASPISRRRLDHRPLPGRRRVPGADLGRQPGTHGDDHRRRPPPGAGDRPRPAPVHARTPRDRRSAHVDRRDPAPGSAPTTSPSDSRCCILRSNPGNASSHHAPLSRASAAARSANVLTLISSPSSTATVTAPSCRARARMAGSGSALSAARSGVERGRLPPAQQRLQPTVGAARERRRAIWAR